MKGLLLSLTFLFGGLLFSQTSSENYILSGVGHITIPNSMEIQSGEYKKISGQAQEKFAEKFGFEVSSSRVVFQQKGLNNLEKEGFSSYARVIIETDIGNFGDYEKLTTDLNKIVTAAEFKELDEYLEQQMKLSFQPTKLKLIKWLGTSIERVRDRTALKISYLRQLGDNPYVLVNMYQFHNNDRMHTMTLSYRQSDESTWKPQFSKIINSFTITNVR